MARGTGRAACLAVGVAVLLTLPLGAQPEPDRQVAYQLSFPQPEHRWLQVEAVFPDIGDGAAVLQMSTASPGRYARHEFAKNVFAVELFDGGGRPLVFTRPRASQWRVARHDGTVRVRYRIFGDRVDGTYLAVDSTHAHVNMPATLIWVHGLEERPVRVTFDRPPGMTWAVATQLFSTGDPLVFTAPNLQYLMDSPAEFSDFELRTFAVPDPAAPTNRPMFRLVVHHESAAETVDAFATEVERVVRETVSVFGEFPVFEGNTYTFIADYLPYASGDAMEHRNSAVLTAPARLDQPNRRALLVGSVAHEFVHAWNAERIRPQSLEPFDFTDANVSGELWLAEGFTNYYGALITTRSGLVPVGALLARLGSVLNTVLLSPGRQLHTPVEMSQLAPFTDASTAIDRTNWGNTYISYYTWGEAIALGLDLTLRVRTNGQTTLDDYMREMWRRFGRPGGVRPGFVAHPYTAADAQDVLSQVAGGSAFADDFFARFINGREVVDYTTLLSAAGIRLRPQTPARAWVGEAVFGPGMRVAQPTPYGSPLHEAGVDREDIVESVDGQPVATESDLARIVRTKLPGDAVSIHFVRRGRGVDATLTLAERPHVELVTVESIGETLTSQQREFRDAWLGSSQER